MPRSLFFLLFSLLVLSSCRGPQGLQSNNLAYLYNPQNMALRPHYRIEHLSDTMSRVFYRLKSSELLYTRTSEGDDYKAGFKIDYQVLKNIESSVILDIDSLSFVDMAAKVPNKIISGYFDIKTPELDDDENNKVLFVKLTDLGRGSSFTNFLAIEKASINGASYYVLKDPVSNIIFSNHIPAGVPFKLEHSLLRPKYYFVSHYNREFPLALPPYSSQNSASFELKPDTTFLVHADSLISLSERGFYHFRLDTSQWEGFTIYSFYRHFPLVGEFQDMAEPLRYLTTQKEYEGMLAAKSDPEALRMWIEAFWKSRAGQEERAKTLIAGFYQRVEEANRLFSSYQEGWKTDRGIIFIIYGPPTKVYRSSAGEGWVYGNESSTLSYYFNFINLDNPFSDNDYELERSVQYRYGWGQAIESWRKGHIYNSKDIRREQDAQDQLQQRSRNPMWY